MVVSDVTRLSREIHRARFEEVPRERVLKHDEFKRIIILATSRVPELD
jgi:hypothetical protein